MSCSLSHSGTSLQGLQQFQGRNYYFSWLDEDSRVSGLSTLTVLYRQLYWTATTVLFSGSTAVLYYYCLVLDLTKLLQVRNTKWDWFNARNYCRQVVVVALL